MGVRWYRNNSTSVFSMSVASEKMSNRSKNGSLDSENEDFLARMPKRDVSEADFVEVPYSIIKESLYNAVNIFFMK